ncbi:hypothetical protein ACQVP2_35525, partial [Methylobacterium aquaticum]|uniref:hypothetical protein n=1 Tax=Methylobacterium aquaticum TaxID=270351 RepID=UPI003D17EF40
SHSQSHKLPHREAWITPPTQPSTTPLKVIDGKRTGVEPVVDRRAHQGGYWSFLKDMQDNPQRPIS